MFCVWKWLRAHRKRQSISFEWEGNLKIYVNRFAFYRTQYTQMFFLCNSEMILGILFCVVFAAKNEIETLVCIYARYSHTNEISIAIKLVDLQSVKWTLRKNPLSTLFVCICWVIRFNFIRGSIDLGTYVFVFYYSVQ